MARTTFATALTGSEDHSSSYPNIPDLYESREASHSTNYSFLPSQKSVEKDTEYRYKFRDKSFSPDFKSSSPKSQFFERETAKYFKLLSEERKSLERVVRQNSASRPLIIDCSPRVSFEMADSPVNVERKNEDVCPDLSDDCDRQAEIDMQADKAVTGVLIPEARDDGVNVCSDTEAQSASAVLSSDSLGVKHDEMTVTESLDVSENESDSHVKDSIVAHDNVPEDSKDFSTDLTVEKLGEEVPAPAASSDDQQKAVDSVEQIGTEIESPEQRETVPDSDLNEDNKAVIVEEPTDPEKVVDSETSETSSGTSWEFVAGDTADSPVPFTQADGLQQPQRPDAQTDLLTEDTELGLSTDTVTPEEELQHSAILMTSGDQKDGESPTKILPSEPHEEANIESDTSNTPDVVSAHVVTPMEEDIWDEGNVSDEIKPDAEPEGQSDEGILLDSSLADDDAKPADLELIGDETPATRQQITEGSPLETIPTEDISETQPELTPDEQLVSETNQDYQTIDEDPDKTQKSVDYLSNEQKAEEELYDLGRNLTEEYRQHQQILPEDEPVLDLQPAVENEVAEDDRFAAEEKLELPKGDVIQSLQEDNEFAQNVSENTATGSLLDHYGDSGGNAYTAEEEPYEVETPAGIRATDSIEEEGDFEQELGLSLESDVHESLQELETALSAHQVASHPHHQMELAEEDQDDMITDPYEEYVSRSRNTSVDQTAAMRDDLIYQEQMLSLQDNMATSEEDLPTEVEEYKMMQQSAELSSPEVTVRDSESPPHSLAPTTVTKEGSRSLAEIQQEVKLKSKHYIKQWIAQLCFIFDLD